MSDNPATWPPAAMLADFWAFAPDEERARALADALAARGHRWVRVRPVHHPHLDPEHRLFGRPEFSRPELEGWWQVGALVDEQAPDPAAEFHQHHCESIEVAAVAREHGGYLEGSSMGHRETMLRFAERTGLVHELGMEEAHAARRAVIAGFPAPREPMSPSVPLDCPDGGDLPPLLETTRQVARDVPGAEWWLSDEADGFEDDDALVFHLADSAMHQGTCYPHTAREVRLLAGLAARRDVRPRSRTLLIDLLAEAGTIGRRLVAATADRRRALGLGFEESDDERAARRAVEAEAPALLARWDEECEAVRFARQEGQGE
ncbi:MAG TPA: hypothetical protein VHJ17_17430, partial [Thermomonospora sp.]|nr:hypothetical protein [Thermomonospora sp.]